MIKAGIGKKEKRQRTMNKMERQVEEKFDNDNPQQVQEEGGDNKTNNATEDDNTKDAAEGYFCEAMGAGCVCRTYKITEVDDTLSLCHKCDKLVHDDCGVFPVDLHYCIVCRKCYKEKNPEDYEKQYGEETTMAVFEPRKLLCVICSAMDSGLGGDLAKTVLLVRCVRCKDDSKSRCSVCKQVVKGAGDLYVRCDECEQKRMEDRVKSS